MKCISLDVSEKFQKISVMGMKLASNLKKTEVMVFKEKFTVITK
jgi:hypothetical protein